MLNKSIELQLDVFNEKGAIAYDSDLNRLHFVTPHISLCVYPSEITRINITTYNGSAKTMAVWFNDTFLSMVFYNEVDSLIDFLKSVGVASIEIKHKDF